MKKTFPRAPGVYFFKDRFGCVIYTGKAKNIHKRVQSYFSKQKTDWKVETLLQEYADIDYILTKNETEALLLEAQIVRAQRPKFNVLLKEGQPFIYILFTRPKIGFARVELVRNKKKKGKYFGPFLHKKQARSAYRYLIQTFRLSLCKQKIANGCLDYHIGLCAGSCREDFDYAGYLFRLQLAQDALKNNHGVLVKNIKQQIRLYNQQLQFEKAMHLNEYLENLDVILHTLQIKFSESKYQELILEKTAPIVPSKISEIPISIMLQNFLGVKKPIRTIDCFDISHFQSNSIVGSCVRFTDGSSDKEFFRKFKVKGLKKQNDYAALQEIVIRRYKNCPENIPDLVLIDGGKGQLHAVQKVLPDVFFVSLAKRQERLFGSLFPDGILLNVQEPVGKLLIALRDYAHHFAISYHRVSRSKELRP